MQGLDKLSPTRAAKIFELAWKYREVFEPVKPGKSTNVRPYPLKSGEDEEFVKDELKKLLKENYIEKSVSSPYQAPILVVPKKGADGKTKKRLCLEYRSLNKITKRDGYNMPNLDESLRTGDAKLFTKIDLASALWQVPVLPRDREKTEFSFQGQMLSWRVMPFGLTN